MTILLLSRAWARWRAPKTSLKEPLLLEGPSFSTYLQVLRFLRGEGPDGENRSLDSILNQNDEWWEESHNFVQWLFPNTAASDYVVGAPVLSLSQMAQLGRDATARAGLLRADARFLHFLGLCRTTAGQVIELPPEPEALSHPWLRRPDHNDLRVTRLLHCLSQAGLSNDAHALLAFLETRFESVSCKSESLPYWRDAVRSEP